ncbi:transglutaminase-like domain-containing protein [Blastopirellula sp. JC732]|uniref:Transglutaminase-like domain-containing protein n=1 Tax=Blastopirellula sediminis TaxID=2894196 RepID=A0A9X1SIE4_9BACT|nr:transglutaminase-like domain-containing protein [Blastopirellula sediminis]MCC9605955.1 transglutaminase-like domain-containing protein [Blastopirellula sediminis]MCC9630746.1 transglutaminase-like domain-containing protein [Blastopirellula sediminis]
MNTILRSLPLVTIVLLATSLSIGCTTQVAQSEQTQVIEPQQAEQKPAPAPQKPRNDLQPKETLHELWSAVVQQGKKIGNSHEVVRRVQQADRELIESVSTENIAIRRQQITIEMQVVNRFLETPDGKLVSYETSIEQGGNHSSVAGQVSADGKQLMITTTGAGKSFSAPIAWKPEWGGVYAASQLLENPPIEPGQTRETTALVPTINQACQIKYVAGQLEPVKLLDGSEVELLKVTNKIALGGKTLMEVPMWVDREGNSVKMEPPGPEMVIYRCTKEFAESPIEAIEFDLAAETIVPTPEPLPDVHTKLKSAEYLVTLKKKVSPSLFPTSGGQWSSDLQEESLHLHEIALRPDTPLPPPLAQQTPPTEADLAASSLVQVEDPEVQKIAAQAKTPNDQTWKLAVELEKLVRNSIEQKDFSQAFASAAEVAKMKAGDCTEHSVLLIAILRAHKIPARAAVGLVYYDGKSGRGFAYHMWTEAWINNRWIPLDATLGQGGIGVGHVKIADSDLSGGGALAAFLPVTQVIGNIEIKPIKLE